MSDMAEKNTPVFNQFNASEGSILSNAPTIGSVTIKSIILLSSGCLPEDQKVGVMVNADLAKAVFALVGVTVTQATAASIADGMDLKLLMTLAGTLVANIQAWQLPMDRHQQIDLTKVPLLAIDTVTETMHVMWTLLSGIESGAEAAVENLGKHIKVFMDWISGSIIEPIMNYVKDRIGTRAAALLSALQSAASSLIQWSGTVVYNTTKYTWQGIKLLFEQGLALLSGTVTFMKKLFNGICDVAITPIVRQLVGRFLTFVDAKDENGDSLAKGILKDDLGQMMTKLTSLQQLAWHDGTNVWHLLTDMARFSSNVIGRVVSNIASYSYEQWQNYDAKQKERARKQLIEATKKGRIVSVKQFQYVMNRLPPEPLALFKEMLQVALAGRFANPIPALRMYVNKTDSDSPGYMWSSVDTEEATRRFYGLFNNYASDRESENEKLAVFLAKSLENIAYGQDDIFSYDRHSEDPTAPKFNMYEEQAQRDMITTLTGRPLRRVYSPPRERQPVLDLPYL